jgi:hypothetical protein
MPKIAHHLAIKHQTQNMVKHEIALIWIKRIYCGASGRSGSRVPGAEGGNSNP